MYKYEEALQKRGYRRIAGTDEVGRGPLAGPLVCAAVILDPQNPIEGLNDSKKLSEKKREFLFDEIKEKAMAFSIVYMDEETIDVTLPGKHFSLGNRHLLTQMVEEVEDLLLGMGYQIMEGPEVESDLYNFEKLNLPKDHPARDMQGTFYITEDTLLRTHTSPVQVRTMLEYGGTKPIKIICPGKVYRRDDDDATHSHQFMQIEGLVVDEKTSMADLKGTLLEIANKVFKKQLFKELRIVKNDILNNIEKASKIAKYNFKNIIK